MFRIGLFSASAVLLTLVVWLTGCSDSGSVSGLAVEEPFVASTSPLDGATDVATSTPIVFGFNTPMDTMSVMEHFHCSGGNEMWEWMDSLQHHGQGPGPRMTDMDHMMDWMRDIEHDGEFHWNDEMTECVFRPDSGFVSDSDYMIYLEGNIRSHGGEMMDMNHSQYDGFMIHFRTGP